MTDNNDRRDAARRADAAHRADTRRIEEQLAQRQADREEADRGRQTAAHLVGGLVEDHLLVGVPVAALAIWLQQRKDARGQALDQRLVEWQRANDRAADGVAGLSQRDGALDSAGAAQTAAFLGSTPMPGGGTALDEWDAAPVAAATPVGLMPAPDLIAEESPKDRLDRLTGGSAATPPSQDGPRFGG